MTTTYLLFEILANLDYMDLFSEHSLQFLSLQLDTTDSTFSENSLGGDFDYKEHVPS